MVEEIITFGEKHKFQHYESPIFLEDVDIKNKLVSSLIYFIYYLYDDYKIKLLHIMLPQTSAM